MAMIVQCNQCATKFKVDETRVGPSGAKVRCTKCKNVFTVSAPGSAPAFKPAAPAAAYDDDFGNKTQMYRADTFSGDIAVNSRKAAPAGPSKASATSATSGTSPASAPAATPPAKPPAAAAPKAAAGPPKRTGPAPINYAEVSEKTNVVDTTAYLKGLKVPELPQGPAQEDQPTRVSKVADLAKLAASEGEEDQPTRVGKVADLAKLAASVEADQPTRVGRVENLAKLTAMADNPGGFEDVGGVEGVELTPLPPPDPPPEPPFEPPPEPQAQAGKRAERRAPLGSEENPAPVGKGDFRVPTQALVTPTSAVSEADLARGKQQNRLISIAAGAVLFLGFVLYGFSDRIYGNMRAGANQLPEVQLDTSDLLGVRLVRTRSLLYPMKNGSAALIVAGEAINKGDQPQTDMDVVVELRDRTGKPAKTANVPLGMLLDMEQVVTAQSQADWQSLILDWRRKAPPGPVQPAVSTPFLAVLIDPPQPLGEYAQSIHLAPTPPLPPAAVPEPPAPVAEPEPPPPAPVAEAPKPEKPEKVDKKVKKAAKPPKKTHKSSRRATDD